VNNYIYFPIYYLGFNSSLDWRLSEARTQLDVSSHAGGKHLFSKKVIFCCV